MKNSEKEKEIILDKKQEKEEDNNNNKKEEKNTLSKSINSDVYKIITSKVGLRNLGNTCFMNTCLQNLIHTEFFIKELFSKKHLISSQTPISQNFYEICKELISPTERVFSPRDFKFEFGLKHSMFSGYGQHDTQEFCRILLEDMNKELNIVKKTPPYKEMSFKESKKVCDKMFDEEFRKRERNNFR